MIYSKSAALANIYTLIILRLVHPLRFMEGETPGENSSVCVCVSLAVCLSVRPSIYTSAVRLYVCALHPRFIPLASREFLGINLSQVTST